MGRFLLGRNMGNHGLQYLREHVLHLSLFAVVLFAVLYLLVTVIDRRRPVIVKE